MTCVHRLTVEHLLEPRGLTIEAPRLSWVLPGGLSEQTTHQIQVTGPGLEWDSGLVESPDHVLVPYEGPPVPAATRVQWRVRASTAEGPLGWSEWSSWETGLFSAEDWTAQWISPVGEMLAAPGERPPIAFRSTFDIDTPPRHARAYVTAHGIYELFVNGERLGDAELTPGFTSYRDRLQVQVFDATSALRAGSNHVVAVVSDGWFRGKFGFTQRADAFGTALALLAELRVDGEVIAATDASWTWGTGRVIAADLMDGEIVDFGRQSELDPSTPLGHPVAVVEHGYANLVGECAPPVKRVAELAPTRISRLDDQRQVVDFGQNLNGWVRLSNLGPAGTTITLTHGEMLDASGDVTLDHLAAFEMSDASPKGPAIRLLQRDIVRSDGSAGEFEPRHTTHGFQYVRVEGHPGDLQPGDITAIAVNTDVARRGSFECSDVSLNALHHAAEWSFLGNACDVPTDCPQRERAPWTGDWQVFQPTAAFLFDIAGFSTKWLRSLDADRWPDGRVPNFAPDPGGRAIMKTTLGNYITGSSGWGDAAVLVPWDLWRIYGDRQILDEMWPMMSAWVDFAANVAATGRHSSRIAARPDADVHERYIWDTGFHWGEWCEPEPDQDPIDPRTDHGAVATAYLYRSSSLLARIAELLGRPDDADRYHELARKVRVAWQKEFLTHDSRLTVDRQAEYVRALAFGLAPEFARRALTDRLVELIRENDTHLSTGFLATPLLLPTLADNGYLDVAYELLLQRTRPSWLAMIDRGATTIWENWDGAESGSGSLNHYSKGAVISFLHTHVAGIKQLDDHPAYERFVVQPMPGGGITWVRAHHDTPHGRIESSWRIDEGTFSLIVEVPSGALATVVLPDGTARAAGPGQHTYECTLSTLEASSA